MLLAFLAVASLAFAPVFLSLGAEGAVFDLASTVTLAVSLLGLTCFLSAIAMGLVLCPLKNNFIHFRA